MPSTRHTLGGGALAVAVATALVAIPSAPAYAAAAVTVDFTTTLATISEDNIGLDITGYGGHHYITETDRDQKHFDNVRRQGFGVMRMDLHYSTPGDPNSALVCGGSYCDTAVPGDEWVEAIRELGAEPMLILPVDFRYPAATNVADSVNLYQHFAALGTPVNRFVVGNELDNGDNPARAGWAEDLAKAEYNSRFNQIYDAIRALDADAEIGGLALATYDWHEHWVDSFLATSGSRVDFVDYHDYGAGGDRFTDEEMFGKVLNDYTSDLVDLRARINAAVPSRAAAIDIQIGEWNMDYTDPDGTEMVSHKATVWGAAALGTMLEQDAYTLIYGDKNGSLPKNTGLGITSGEGEGGIPVSDPMPIYHGLGMFTGEGLFRGFGTTVVDTTSNDASLRVFASTNNKSVVLVNTATSANTANIAFNGLTAGTAAVWQSTGTGAPSTFAPKQVGTTTIANSATSVSLPARSVTTLVIGEGNFTGTYYDNMDFTGASVTRKDGAIDFDWGQAAPHGNIAADTFSVRWTGTVTAPAAGNYRFTATTDDGVRVWVDGTLVVDAWTDHSKRDDAGVIALTAGSHTVRMDYYDNGYDAIAQLRWAAV